MADPIILSPTDPCPSCGGHLRSARVPSDEQWARAHDRENPITLPRDMDSATPEQRATLGALYRCGTCGYLARFAPTLHRA